MGSDGLVGFVGFVGCLAVLMDPVASSFVANSPAIVAQMLPFLLGAFVECVAPFFFVCGGLANICTARPCVDFPASLLIRRQPRAAFVHFHRTVFAAAPMDGAICWKAKEKQKLSSVFAWLKSKYNCSGRWANH